MEPKIIVVDQSDFSRRITVKLLEELNLSVIGEANTSASALELLNNVYCNMCLIDLNLGEKTGIEVAELIREKSEGLGIIITSYLMLESLKIDAVLAGASDFLIKPLDKNNLEKSIYYLEHVLTQKE